MGLRLEAGGVNKPSGHIRPVAGEASCLIFVAIANNCSCKRQARS